jgi:NAD(P)H-hydrate epimerase
MPSGLMGEDNSINDCGAIVRATCTLTFQFPKLSFFFRENDQFTGKWEVLPIGIDTKVIEQTETLWHYSDIKTMATILKPRGKFSHKGTYGHALLVAGSRGKMGAAILSAKGCLRSGVGLLSVQVSFDEIPIIQIAVP